MGKLKEAESLKEKGKRRPKGVEKALKEAAMNAEETILSENAR